jgi:hypothetical protein
MVKIITVRSLGAPLPATSNAHHVGQSNSKVPIGLSKRMSLQ